MNLSLCDGASWREGTARQIDTGIEPVAFRFTGKSKSVRAGDRHFESTATDWLRSDEAVVLVGGCANDCHWLIDYLPRLMLVEGMAQYGDCPIVINGPMAAHQRQALALLDVNPQRWLSLSLNQANSVPRVVSSAHSKTCTHRSSEPRSTT